jgi:hypothetical protein
VSDPKSRVDDSGVYRQDRLPGIDLVNWSNRFWIWFIDAVVVAMGILFGILSMPMWLYGFANGS